MVFLDSVADVHGRLLNRGLVSFLFLVTISELKAGRASGENGLCSILLSFLEEQGKIGRLELDEDLVSGEVKARIEGMTKTVKLFLIIDREEDRTVDLLVDSGLVRLLERRLEKHLLVGGLLDYQSLRVRWFEDNGYIEPVLLLIVGSFGVELTGLNERKLNEDVAIGVRFGLSYYSEGAHEEVFVSHRPVLEILDLS